ncbi:MAG: NAD(P)H-dependent oxidoreductase subunit E [Candidatus Kaelpia aquatica]|nr:NAD(P)H-dependent oxidoreductase subunit E [Candidatus Kaelpia aquatica]
MKDGKEHRICDETRSELLPILQKIQDKKGYISDKDMQQVADKLGIHPVEVYSVITFYSFLNCQKEGQHTIRVSSCISSVMKGSKKIVKEFEKALGIRVGETTGDKKITLKETSCIGMCDMAPAIMVDSKLVGKVTAQKVKEIVKELKI